MSAALALRVDRFTIMRGLMAGTAWGVAMSAGLFGLTLMQCGAIPCPDDTAFSTAVCVTIGILAIGPLAAFRRPAR